MLIKFFFLQALIILKKNLKTNIFVKEKKWLKKICKVIKSRYLFIFLQAVFIKRNTL